MSSPFLKAIFLSFIKEISFGAAQIHDLRTAIPLQKQKRKKRDYNWIDNLSKV